jgi:hypothetical protein
MHWPWVLTFGTSIRLVQALLMILGTSLAITTQQVREDLKLSWQEILVLDTRTIWVELLFFILL